MFESSVMMLAKEMPVTAVAQMLGEIDTRLWRLIMIQVEEAHRQSDWSEVKAIAIDETSVRKVTQLFPCLGWSFLILAGTTARVAAVVPEKQATLLFKSGSRFPAIAMHDNGDSCKVTETFRVKILFKGSWASNTERPLKRISSNSSGMTSRAFKSIARRLPP